MWLRALLACLLLELRVNIVRLRASPIRYEPLFGCNLSRLDHGGFAIYRLPMRESL